MTLEYPDIYDSYDDARDSIVGVNDDVAFFNPATGRPLKNYNKYDEVMMYSENTRLGYHGIAHLVKKDKGVEVVYEIFDQSGELTFKEMLEAAIN